MARPRQAAWIVLGALAGVVLWSLAHRWLPRAELAESNYQANLIRLQSWIYGAPKANVIIGSSIAGRLLPEDFAGTSLAGIANLALDGSGPELGLRLVLARGNPPPRVFIEVHRLGKPWGINDETLLAALREPGFALAGAVPALRADSRPSTLLYAWLKRRRDPSPVTMTRPATKAPGRPPSPEGFVRPQWFAHFAEQVAELRRRGGEVILLRLPVGRENPADPFAPNEADSLAQALGLKLMDLNREAARRGMGPAYSDGLHLTSGSARRMCVLLAELTVESQASGVVGPTGLEPVTKGL